jgi:hypothetical protein
MLMNRLLLRAFCLGALCVWCVAGRAAAEEFLLADGASWPGKLLTHRQGRTDTIWTRPGRLPNDAVPRVQSLARLPSGDVIFCSGLDRSLFESARGGEREFHHGGYLARQVRTDTDGTLYWSGLETPSDGNPLPDGFLYAWDTAAGSPRTVLTFSQAGVGHDWWGAFAVREGRVYVGTLRDRTRIYELVDSVPRQVTTLPFSAPAFRFAADGSLYACDGRGTLYRFADWRRPEQSEVVLRLPTAFVDFEFGSAPRERQP